MFIAQDQHAQSQAQPCEDCRRLLDDLRAARAELAKLRGKIEMLQVAEKLLFDLVAISEWDCMERRWIAPTWPGNSVDALGSLYKHFGHKRSAALRGEGGSGE